jgi:hypothetical protein
MSPTAIGEIHSDVDSRVQNVALGVGFTPALRSPHGGSLLARAFVSDHTAVVVRALRLK